MSIHDCCGTTCDKQSVLDELTELRTFKARVHQILIAAERDAQPIGRVAGSGMLSNLINENTPVAITRFRAVDAYLIPEKLIREVLDCGY